MSFGVPETIRTSDPFLRREVLYPAELRGQVMKSRLFIAELTLRFNPFDARTQKVKSEKTLPAGNL